MPVVFTGRHNAWAQTWGVCRFPRVPSPPWSNGCVPTVHDTAARTPPALPCLQHAEQNASQRSWRWGSSKDWAILMADSKFPEVKGFYIHILHHLSMAPDWNSWFTEGLVNSDLACLVFLPCSLQVEDNSSNDVYTFFFFNFCSTAVLLLRKKQPLSLPCWHDAIRVTRQHEASSTRVSQAGKLYNAFVFR